MATKQIAIAISGLLDDLGIREQTRGIKLRKKKYRTRTFTEGGMTPYGNSSTSRYIY